MKSCHFNKFILFKEILLLLVSVNTHANVIHVDCHNTTGIENGSPVHPFRMIQKALDVAPADSTVLVAPGSYQENIIMKERVHLRGSGPSVTYISGEGQQLRSGLVLWAVIWAADHSLLEGFTITVTPPDDSYNRYAVQGYTEDRNDPIIANNVFMGGSGNCLVSFWGGSARIVNNTFFGNQFQYSLISVNNHRRSGIPVVANNIFASNQSRDVVSAHNGAQPEVSFNMLWDNRLGGQDFRGFTPGLGNKWENPCFINPASGDLRLSPSSPAIDAGDNDSILPFLLTDLPSRTVINGTIDMGAYESGSEIVSKTYYVDAATGEDNRDGLSLQSALATIHRGVELAKDGDIVHVYPGLYGGEVDFLGKAITIHGVATQDGIPILENPGDFAVSLYRGEGPDSVLTNFVIRDSLIGIFLAATSPTIRNITLIGNNSGMEAYVSSKPDIVNCIFWGNRELDLFQCEARYSRLDYPDQGQNNISDDPLFVDLNNGDYHLRSNRGRYWPEHDVWVLDKDTSPCIDTGDPSVGALDEPMPNGGRINIGAYGGTKKASLSSGQPSLLRGRASNPSPLNGAVGVSINVILRWTPGFDAASHHLYFGTEFDHVNPSNANNMLVGLGMPGTSYNPGLLEHGQTYYWRVDEVDNQRTIVAGDVWSFTTVSSAPPKGRACFTGDTLVWIDGTPIPISKAALGQVVTSTEGVGKIDEVQAHTGMFACYDVLLESGNCISVVECHYFMTEFGRWISLPNLKTGTRLKTSKGTVGILSITKRPTPYIGKVFNLKIEGSDQYLVGKDAIVVRDY